MFKWIQPRHFDPLGSSDIDNEPRGHTAIDRVPDANRVRSPGDVALIAAIEQRRADERDDRVLMKIFGIIRRDEPSHWAPCDGSLQRHGKRDPRWRERGIGRFIHSERLFLSPFLRRRIDGPDASDPATTCAGRDGMALPAG